MTSPDNFPGVYRAPVLMPPPPQAPEVPFAGGTPVQNAQAADAYARREFERYRQTLPPGGELVTGSRRFAATPAAQAADRLADAVGDRLAAAQAKHDGILAGLTVPTDDGAAQTAALRAWQRQKPVLDRQSGSGLMNAITKLVQNASGPNDLAQLYEDVPAYLESRGEPSSYFDDLIATRLPELIAARDEVGKATRARDIIAHNSDTLHRSYQRGTIPPPPVRADIHDPDAA